MAWKPQPGVHSCCTFTKLCFLFHTILRILGLPPESLHRRPSPDALPPALRSKIWGGHLYQPVVIQDGKNICHYKWQFPSLPGCSPRLLPKASCSAVLGSCLQSCVFTA